MFIAGWRMWSKPSFQTANLERAIISSTLNILSDERKDSTKEVETMNVKLNATLSKRDG